MSTEPSSSTAKFASFLTSLGLETSQGKPTTFAYIRLFEFIVSISLKFSSSSLTVVSTDSALPSRK